MDEEDADKSMDVRAQYAESGQSKQAISRARIKVMSEWAGSLAFHEERPSPCHVGLQLCV